MIETVYGWRAEAGSRGASVTCDAKLVSSALTVEAKLSARGGPYVLAFAVWAEANAGSDATPVAPGAALPLTGETKLSVWGEFDGITGAGEVSFDVKLPVRGKCDAIAGLVPACLKLGAIPGVREGNWGGLAGVKVALPL